MRPLNDFNLATELQNYEYKGLTAEAAIEKAYQETVNRLTQPHSERNIIIDALADYEPIFDLYFYVHPKEAEKITHEHNQKYQSWRKIVLPLEKKCWSRCKEEQYNAAKRRVEYDRAIKSSSARSLFPKSHEPDTHH